MDDNFGTWVLGMMSGFVLGLAIMFAISQPVYQCADSALKGATMTWIDERPYCYVEININGENRLIRAEQYLDMMKK